MLHIAPEKTLGEEISQARSVRYMSVDLMSPLAMRHENIEKMSFGPKSFDLILCLDVLEHVTDDAKAMRELRRVVRDSGVCIIDTPIRWHSALTEEVPTKNQIERIQRFGQDDHVRFYGKDILLRLKKAGFQVRMLRVNSKISSFLLQRYGLPDYPLLLCRPLVSE